MEEENGLHGRKSLDETKRKIATQWVPNRRIGDVFFNKSIPPNLQKYVTQLEASGSGLERYEWPKADAVIW